jgi:hypothetical protein
MSNPTWPVYTFTINLETLQRYSWSLPNRTKLDGNETVSEADNVKNTRSTWLTSLFPGVEHIAHKDGYTFTVYGSKAKYIKDMYATGPDAMLRIVS